jgi:long-subunit acyl-CoA synthetase (AMP-forming)
MLAGEMQALGLRKGDKIAVFSENSHKWLLLDGATLKCGAANVVRGVGAPLDELMYIYSNSDSKALAVQTVDLLQKLMSPDALLKDGVNQPEFIIVLDAGMLAFVAANNSKSAHNFQPLTASHCQGAPFKARRILIVFML